MSVSINSHDDVMKLLFNVTRFEMLYPEFIDDVAGPLIDEEILQPIKKEMKTFGYSEKIINGTTIEKLIITNQGFLQFDVVSDYKTKKGFDVAKAREEGTVDHELPKVKGRTYSWLVGGFIRAFSKGHWVKGFAKSDIIKKTIEIKFPIVQERLDQETIKFFNQTVSE